MSSTVLHIDNSEEDLFLVKSLLADQGLDLNLVQKKGAKDALNQLLDGSQFIPDVILLDLNLPGMTGIEFLNIARTSEVLSEVPIVVLSGTRDQKEIRQVLESGANSFTCKEFDIKKYASVLTETLIKYL